MASALTVGCSINIKRTDGRIHSAIVAGIDAEHGTATVEWFEQNETKGKEIDLAAIESLNPELKTPHEEASSVHEPVLNQTARKLQRVSSYRGGSGAFRSKYKLLNKHK